MLQKRHDDATGHAGSTLPIGIALLQDPALNKGTAFTEAERDSVAPAGLAATARIVAGAAVGTGA